MLHRDVTPINIHFFVLHSSQPLSRSSAVSDGFKPFLPVIPVVNGQIIRGLAAELRNSRVPNARSLRVLIILTFNFEECLARDKLLILALLLRSILLVDR